MSFVCCTANNSLHVRRRGRVAQWKGTCLEAKISGCFLFKTTPRDVLRKFLAYCTCVFIFLQVRPATLINHLKFRFIGQLCIYFSQPRREWRFGASRKTVSVCVGLCVCVSNSKYTSPFHRAHLSITLVTDPPTYSRWLKLCHKNKLLLDMVAERR